MKDRIENIQKHELSLNRANELLNKLETIIEEWKKFNPNFLELMEYYQSPEWMEDFDAGNKGVFKDINCGILSEDGIFNMFQRQRELNFKMIRVALNYLE